MTEADALFTRVRRGDRTAFAEWAGHIERPVRTSLWRFGRWVDLEVVLQETLLRMWLIATRTGKELHGESASLRLALAVARNVALEELRRARPVSAVPLEALENDPEVAVAPAPAPDPGLARAIHECLEALPSRLRVALLSRIEYGPLQPDRELARQLGLKLNTFLQHIVRARRRMAECLDRKGVELAGVAS
ncbi:MAG TPA: sigma-70 family RNA polymerase sigma factor [Candidatus Eisenbacteria bacterium]|jgi:RNA polymerase sigma-70 factor (ECF subfamily)